MGFFVKQFKQILFIPLCLLAIGPVIAQVKPQPATKSTKPKELDDQIREFYRLLKQSDIVFTYPKGFLEIMAPNNEEYFQASTNLPLVDVNGNWTIFERRVNEVEANYLLAPNGQKSQTLTTIAGQQAFISNNPGGVQFTASATGSLRARSRYSPSSPSSPRSRNTSSATSRP